MVTLWRSLKEYWQDKPIFTHWNKLEWFCGVLMVESVILPIVIDPIRSLNFFCQHFAGSSININRSWPSFQLHNLTWKCIHILPLINSKHFGIYHMSEFQVLGNQDWTFAIILRQTAVLAFVRRIAKILCRGFYIPVCYCQHYLEWVILT